MDLNKICADVLAWAGKGYTCEIERMTGYWEIRVSKDTEKKTMRLKDSIYSMCQDSTETMLRVHGKNGIYQLGQSS